MSKLPILSFDKPQGLAYAKLIYWLKDAMPAGSYELVCISDPAEARKVVSQAPAVAVLSALNTAAARKFKQLDLGGSKKAMELQHASWKAIGAFAPLFPKHRFDDRSPGTLGTYWRSKHGAYVVGIHNPLVCDWSQRGLQARWLRGAAALGSGTASIRPFRVHLEAPLSLLWERDGLCTFDLETAGFTDTITHFGYADVTGGYSWPWCAETRDAVIRWAQTDRPKVGHNSLGYDVGVLARNGVSLRGPLGDTMALRSVWCRQWGYGLQSVTAQVTMTAPWKAMWKEGLSSEAEYNAKDAEATFWVADYLHTKLNIPYSAGLARSAFHR